MGAGTVGSDVVGSRVVRDTVGSGEVGPGVFGAGVGAGIGVGVGEGVGSIMVGSGVIVSDMCWASIGTGWVSDGVGSELDVTGMAPPLHSVKPASQVVVPARYERHIPSG